MPIYKNLISTTVTLPKSLMTKVCDFYGTPYTSTAVRSGIANFLLLPPSLQQINNKSLHDTLTIDERRDTTKAHVRISDGLQSALRALSPSHTLSEIIAMMLSTVLCHPLSSVNFHTENMHLLRILGSKWDARMQDAIKSILGTANHSWSISIETCVGALGIFANTKAANTEIINDDDWNKINLYRVVQQSPQELILKLYSLEVSKDQFETLKKEKPDPKSKPDVDAAVRYLYLNICSYRHLGNTFLDKMNRQRYYKTLSAIYPLHRRLTGTVICEKDIFKIISKYRKENDALFIVDPNYLEANVYQNRIIRHPEAYKTNFGIEEHKKLAGLLRRIKQTDGNDFIYFCRITATRKKDKQNKIVSTPEELIGADRHLHETINDLYYGYGFYYMDVPLDNGVIERIITSFPFANATAYGKEVL